MFDYSHSGKLFDSNINNLKEKLIVKENENSTLSIPKAKLIDLNYLMDNNNSNTSFKEKQFIPRSFTTSLKTNTLEKEFKLSTSRIEVFF